MTAGERWRLDLESWRIPDEILAQVAESPWEFPAGMFEMRAERAIASPPTPSRLRSLEVLSEIGTVLDVGCGGGAASLPLGGRGRRLVGVDSSPKMLAGFVALGARLGAEVEAIEGEWPACAAAVKPADVVTCHHVVYNVPDLAPFVAALSGHATRRVVVELTRRHPLSGLNPLWLEFHGLDRPSRPTVEDAIAVIRETGVHPAREDWETPAFESAFFERQPAEFTAWIRRRLCLPVGRTAEVAAAIEKAGGPGPISSAREVTTLWWDLPTASPGQAQDARP